MILGEMRGQLREVVHSLANLSGKFDGLSREVIGLGVLAKDVIEVKAELKALQVQVETLKSERDQRTGAVNFVAWCFKNWPGVLGFIALCGLLLRVAGKI